VGRRWRQECFCADTLRESTDCASGHRNGATEGGIIAPLSLNLRNNLTLLFNSEVDILKDTVGGGYHTGFINLVNLSGTIAKDVTLYGEL